MLDRVEWKEVSTEEKGRIMGYINPVQGKYTLQKNSTQMKKAVLPFYEEAVLMEVSDSELPYHITPFWYLLYANRLFELDGSSTPIHEVNELDPVKVTKENAGEYVRFFCFFVHGEEGPFFIIEDSDHPVLDKKKMEYMMIKDIKNKCIPLEYKGMPGDNTFELTGTVFYGNALFSALFTVTANGMIDMTDDEPLKADIPARKIKPNY
ncbi:MAG TPA: hypothetical protein PLT75_13700 [Spirochaetota bacterium]|nr:hypothetical protein [Spirochaetota bacterium]